MTSTRKRKTNRANAQASTGPKTARGKMRAAQNAHRHGLSLPIVSIPALSQQAESLARQIAGGSADRALLEIARRVGEAQVDLDITILAERTQWTTILAERTQMQLAATRNHHRPSPSPKSTGS
jgi:hypothetical protein